VWGPIRTTFVGPNSVAYTEMFDRVSSVTSREEILHEVLVHIQS